MKTIRHTSHLGFTLVELMITISVVTFLLMAVANFTGRWVDRSQVNNAIPTFKNAVFQAQVAALRNTHNLAPTAASVSVCWQEDEHILRIIRLKTVSTDVCAQSSDTTVLQSFSMPKGLSIQQGTDTFKCISFNSAGVLIVASGSGCSNDTKSIFQVGKNNETADITLI